MKMSRKLVSMVVIAALVAALGFFVYQFYSPTGYVTYQDFKIKDFVSVATVYMSQSCGCCALYANYLEGQGIAVERAYVSDISSIKTQYKIPENMQSCHTTVFDGYFVEGHVPLEVVIKLLQEQPSIAGIALPGMPSGSPGMTGTKYGLFKVYAIGHDGEASMFMSI